MAQLVNYLSCKHKGSSSILRNYAKKKKIVGVGVCDYPRTREAEPDGSLESPDKPTSPNW